MKTVEIIGYKRANLGKSDSKHLRAEGNVPCVLYGGEEQIHFYAPAILFRPMVYTDEAHFVHLNIEGEEFEAILQDIQFHPVSEIIMHTDFLQLFEGRKTKMDIPLHFAGTAPGVAKGGNLVKKRRTLKVKALPKFMPEYIEVDISELDFGKSVKIGDIQSENFEILDPDIVSIAVVEVPRALKTAAEEEAEELEAEEGEEGEGSEEGKDGDKEEKSEN